MNRPALALGSGPRGARDARAWVGRVCVEIGRDELLECATLGVSELVTNALLHANAPLQVLVRGTEEHPRFEVRDGSRTVPEMPEPTAADVSGLASGYAGPFEEDLDALEDVPTVGRGLELVSRAAVAWGTDVESLGKIVWFEPADALAEGDGVAGVVSGPGGPESAVSPGLGRAATDRVLSVELGHVPVREHLAFRSHYRELRRELRLLSLAHESDYPSATNLSELMGPLDGELGRALAVDQLDRAHAAGRSHVDARVEVRTAMVDLIGQLSDLLDLADDFCREERLLVLGRSAEQARFARWMLGQFPDQRAGARPKPWVDDTESGIRHTSVS